MQPLISLRLSSLFLAVVFSVLFLSPTVRSDSNFLKLPSDHAAAATDAICPLIESETTTTTTCPVKCFRPDPVCGSDGVTYWCGCADAHCAGATVEKVGFCEVKIGESGTAGQALLLVHIVWMVLLGVFVLFGLF